MSTTLHVATKGSADKTRDSAGTSKATLLFVHGVDSDATVWDSTVDLLSDHRCVMIDLPGHGKAPFSSDPSTYHRDAMLAEIQAVISELARPVVFVGHSLGGYLALAYALTRPDEIDALVLVATGPGFRDSKAREAWNTKILRNAPNFSVQDLAATAALHVDSIVIDRISELKLPTAIVIGDRDKGFRGAANYMATKLPHASFSDVAGADHYVMLSHPTEVAAAIRGISDSLSPH